MLRYNRDRWIIFSRNRLLSDVLIKAKKCLWFIYIQKYVTSETRSLVTIATWIYSHMTSESALWWVCMLRRCSQTRSGKFVGCCKFVTLTHLYFHFCLAALVKYNRIRKNRMWKITIYSNICIIRSINLNVTRGQSTYRRNALDRGLSLVRVYTERNYMLCWENSLPNAGRFSRRVKLESLTFHYIVIFFFNNKIFLKTCCI